MQTITDRSFERMVLPHLNALFQTALRLQPNRRKAELAIEVIYADAWKAFCHGTEWADCRVELFKILCRKIDHADCVACDATDPLTLSLDQIEIPFRMPILLVDCQGFTYNQAAEILSVAVEILADRLRQGRDQLATLITKN